MGFLPIFYAGAYFIVAGVAYLFCPRRDLAKTAFTAILAFGACSYVGFVMVVLAIGSSPLPGLLEGGSQRITYLIAYLLPGVAGAWLSVKILRSMNP